jgi:hypothetical protein
MNRVFTWALIAALCVLASPLPLRAQFTAAEIAERPAIEEFLLTAEIVKWERLGEGVTKPWRLYLCKADQNRRACWKNPSGVMYGFSEGWQYEIAAYRLDKLIGLNMIPVYVEREFQGQKGALSDWAENTRGLDKIVEAKIPLPVETNNAKYLTRAWDSLIANEDRTQQNILYTSDWRTILFDHSRSFRSTGEFVTRLMNGRDGIKKTESGQPWLFRRLPRWFVAQLKALNFQSIRGAVGPYLTDAEIKALLVRRDLLLQEVDLMVKEQGEAAVLYD